MPGAPLTVICLSKIPVTTNLQLPCGWDKTCTCIFATIALSSFYYHDLFGPQVGYLNKFRIICVFHILYKIENGVQA